ncbi:unnamed protein product [Prunus armeniaca]
MMKQRMGSSLPTSFLIDQQVGSCGCRKKISTLVFFFQPAANRHIYKNQTLKKKKKTTLTTLVVENSDDANFKVVDFLANKWSLCCSIRLISITMRVEQFKEAKGH